MVCLLEFWHWKVGMWTTHTEAVRKLQFAGPQASNVTFSVSHTLRSADIKKQALSIRAERVRRACAYCCSTDFGRSPAHTLRP